MRPRSNHGARLEPVGGQRRINFLPAVLARLKLADDRYSRFFLLDVTADRFQLWFRQLFDAN